MHTTQCGYYYTYNDDNVIRQFDWKFENKETYKTRKPNESSLDFMLQYTEISDNVFIVRKFMLWYS